MRLTSHNVQRIGNAGEWEIARPYNFLFLPMVDPLFGLRFTGNRTKKFCWYVHFPRNRKNGLTWNA